VTADRARRRNQLLGIRETLQRRHRLWRDRAPGAVSGNEIAANLDEINADLRDVDDELYAIAREPDPGEPA
jgi:hypothetical protein